jgi:hypothetical protein
MRGIRAAFVVVLLLAGATGAGAQTAAGPLFRADLAGSLGWLNADKSELDASRYSNDWYNRSVYGGASFAWYWTDHWKTEIEGGASSAADLQVYTQTDIDNRPVTLNSRHRFSTRRLAIGQQYQFYRNVWVHPFVTAGLDLTWERQDRTDEIYSSLPSRVERYPTRTELLARPFATAGLKAYFNSQTYFRTDMKFTFDRGVDEVLIRFGVGVDF